MARVLRILLLAALLAGCGSAAEAPDGASASPDPEARDAEVERHLAERARAAAAGDRQGVRRAEVRLDELAAQTERPAPASDDPFLALVQSFKFKQAPLYVQQIESLLDTRELVVRVNRDAFCLLDEPARRAAVSSVYAELLTHGVDDFELILTPLEERTSARADALALGRGGAAELTPAGVTCEKL